MAKFYINDDWKFSEKFDEVILGENSMDYVSKMVDVRIPHTVKETPFNYFDEHIYQMISAYRRVISAPKEWEGKSVILTFDAVGHVASVFLNGEQIGKNDCGYTAFSIDISDKLNFGEDNILVVKCDSREDVNVPPFGFVIDYMTYGGIYRDVYIDVREKTHIKNLFLYTRLANKYTDFDSGYEYCDRSRVCSRLRIEGDTEGLIVRQSLKKLGNLSKGEAPIDSDYKVILETELTSENNKTEIKLEAHSRCVELWDVDNPVLYSVKTEIIKDGEVLDTNETNIGYRKAVFKKTGFYLNGNKLKLRGLNRHQSYPYVGYAMPDSMQRNDARILKCELGLNAVRTSHYPQSQSFIDECDRLGLLVFTEIPGWQHIGDKAWKKVAVKNVRRMVVQYRNHPSIILWGVRINESIDDDELYMMTNKLARALDSTRQTGGVRYLKKSSFLEDVYTYNDFSHTGGNRGCEKKRDVTSDVERPYLVSEYNGHMFPTKSFDGEEHRMAHMKRHARVLDSVAGEPDIAGSFGWCMFDYNTHKDFGSGDRICYHGVLDMFRNPKMAAYVYAIQQDKTPVLFLSSTMDIGEHPGSNRGDVYILSNADSVKMYKNDRFIKEYFPTESEYENLLRGPVRIDDYIGDALDEGESDLPKKARDELKLLLNEVSRAGLYNVKKSMLARAGLLSVRYKISMNDAINLYNKYIGDWGSSSTEYRFEAMNEGEVVKTLVIKPMTEKKLVASADHTELFEGKSYDVSAIRFKMTDDNNNQLVFSNEPIILTTTGPIEIIGPTTTQCYGGMGGTYVKTVGEEGKASLSLETTTGEKCVIEFEVKKEV